MESSDIISKHVEPKKLTGPLREEWDFTDDYRLPDEQLEHALWYEYARGSEEMLKRHKAWICHDLKLAGSFSDVPTKVLKEYSTDRPLKGSLSVGETFALFYWLKVIRFCDDFPKMPWLKIDQKKRTALIKAYESDPITTFLRRFFDLRGFEVVDNSALDCPPEFSPDWQTLIAVKIDWRIPPRKIKADFNAWVEKHRRDVKTIQCQSREKLKVLGAMRVWKHFQKRHGDKRGTGWKVLNDSVKFTSSAAWSSGSKPLPRGKPLYGDTLQAWERAVREAKTVQDELFNPPPGPLKRVVLDYESWPQPDAATLNALFFPSNSEPLRKSG